MNNILKVTFSLLLLAVTFSCIDNQFDEPPIFEPPIVETNGTIEDLLSYWSSGDYTEITEDLIIDGRVVANDESGNFYKQLVIEDETGGIQVRLDAIGLYNEYPMGRKVNVFCKGLYISDYNGLPQLSSISGSGANISSIAIPEPLIPEYISNTNDTEVVEPKLIGIQNASQDLVNTLIRINDVQFSVGSAAKPLADAVNQFSVNHDIEDCNGRTMLVRTSGFASFASEFTPVTKGSITGILSVFRGDYQLLLRDTDDISMEDERCGDPITGGNGGDPVDEVNEDFESLGNNEDAELDGWLNIAVKGSRLWRAREFDNNVYVQATAFNDTSPEMEAWLITPKIKFDSPMKLTLRTAIAFYVHDGLSVYYSKDFDGANVNSATWEPLNITKAGSSQSNYAWVSSGNIDLSEIEGEAYIGFKYVGNPVNGTTSAIIDDVKVIPQ